MASGRVLVLGAGSSVFAEYPIASDLESFVARLCQHSDPQTRSHAKEVLNKLAQSAELLKRQTGRVWNLEELISYLELVGPAAQSGTKQSKWTAEDQAKLSRAVSYSFQQHQVYLNGIIQQAGYPGPAGVMLIKATALRWANWVQAGDTIISFNWDLLQEVILWVAAKWSYLDGYGFESPTVPPGLERSLVRILKLHGSVNWVQENEKDRAPQIAYIDEFFPDKFPRTQYYPSITPRRDTTKANQLDSGRKLILPTYLKDISKNRVLLDVWRLAQDALRAATEVWVIGYSLNPADHSARLLFGTELGRNTTLSTGTVINGPAGLGEWDQLLQSAGKRAQSVPQRFEEWLAHIASSPYDPFPKGYSRFSRKAV